MVLIIKRRAVPAADPLVADAIKAQPVLSDIEKSMAHWERFPHPMPGGSRAATAATP